MVGWRLDGIETVKKIIEEKKKSKENLVNFKVKKESEFKDQYLAMN